MKYPFIASFIVALIAALARIPLLTSRTIWFDEAYAWKLTNHFTWFEMIARTAGDVHPPFDYLSSRLIQSFAGDSIVIPRIAALLCSIFAIFLLMRLSIADKSDAHPQPWHIAIWTGLLIAFHADHIRWSQEARIYATMICLVIVSTYFLSLWIAGQSNNWTRLGYVLSATFLVYTHNFGLFYVAVQVIFALAYWGFDIREPSAKTSLNYSLLLCPFVLYLPWVPILWRQVTAVKEGYWINTVSLSSILATLPDHFFSDFEAVPVPTIVCAAITAVIMFAACWAFIQGSLLDKLLASISIGPFLIAIFISLTLTPVLTPRYLVPSTLLMIPVFVRMLFQLAPGWFAHSACSIVLAMFIANYANQMKQMANSPGMKAICQTIMNEGSPDEPVVVLRSYLLFEAQYYLRHEHNGRQVFAIHDAGKASFFGGGPLTRKDEVRKADALYALAGKVWVIDSDAWGYGNEAEPPPGWHVTDRPPLSVKCPHAGWGHIRLREFTR